MPKTTKAVTESTATPKTTTPAETTPESTTPAPTAPETTETTTPIEETPVPATAKKTTNKIVPGSKKNTAPVATPKSAPVVPEKKAKAPKVPAAEKAPPGFRWTEKRVAIVKALRALKATSELNARNCEEVKAQAGEEISLNDVKHYLYKDNDLVTEGYTGCVKGLEGLKGIGYFLTEKGRAVKLP